VALDAPNRKAPRRKPARKAAPKRPASRGPQGLPGPSKPVVTKKMVRARKRTGPTNVQLLVPGGRSKGPQGLPGPKQAHTPGLKKSVRQEVRKERKRLHLTTKAGLGKDRSIESLVNELRIARRATSRRSPVLGGLLGHDVKYYDRHTGKKIPTASIRNPDTMVMKLATGETDLRKASFAAPVLKVLDQTTRPLHGVAGGVDAALKGKNVLKATGRGLANKDKKTFSDVLKTAHAPKLVQSTVGFGLDVLADPTTYVTFGAGGIIKKASLDAARQAERKALEKGLTHEQAQRFGQRAATRVVTAAKKQGHPDARGVTVKFGGKEVPGVRRATAKANKGVQKVAPRPAKRAGSGARHVAADFNPNIKPDHLTHDEYATIREATRTARSTASRQTHIARQRARAIQKEVGEKNYQQVLDAIEAGKIGDLPIELRKPARFLRDQFKYIRRVQTRSGIPVANRRNYVPHVRSEGLDEPARGMGTKSVGTRKITPSSSKARTDQRTLADIRKSDPGKYVEDPGVIYAARMTEGARSASKATLNRRLGEMGRRVRKGKPVDLGPNEAVYHIQGSNIRKLDLGERDAAKRKAAESELQRAVDGQGKNGQYVILNAQAVDRALKTVTPSGERSSTGAVVDKVQGVWKLIATQPNPGFHLRNTAGGVQNAYLNQSGHKLVGNLVHSTRALKHLNAEEKAHNVIGKMIDPGDKGLVIDGRKKLYSDIIKEAQDVGAIRSGFAARELTDLIENKNKIRTGSHFQALKRLANNIEDVTRLATYIEGRKSGLTAEKASARSARFHFDYSDLTELERQVLRRVMPFYTFSARNIPLQMMSLVQRPGKFAQYQKVREEFAKAFGIDLDKADSQTTEADQRSAAIFVRVNGKRVGLSLGPSGLPLTDLSEFPTTANPSKLADEWLNRAMSMVSPGIKTPAELWANLSFFFRAPIERDTGPLVPAPSWVASAPPKVRKELGIVSDYVDKQTGKTGWGWPAKLAYVTNVLPGPFSFVNRTLTESDRPGQSTGNKVVRYLGLSAKQVDPTSTGITNLYDERGLVEKQMAGLRQRMNPNKQGPISADNPTPEYTRLNDKHKALTADIMRLKTKRGDVINGGRKSSGLVFNDPKINAALDKLRSENASKFDADIESKLEKLRR
jgi:hypothetical protein